MAVARAHPVLIAVGIVLGLLGLVLIGAGGWLIALGGSWYYLLAGLALLAVGILLARAHRYALIVYAGLLAASLLWALWETGLNWWPLAPRMGLWFLIGLLLLLPPITRRLVPPLRKDAPPSRGRLSFAHGAGVPLSLVLVLVAVVSLATWWGPRGGVEGELPGMRAQPALDPALDAGQWHAYGGSGLGQRYSPLDQITPQNVAQLKEVWRYHTGDVRGRPGDPEETTFEVTPLKIGDRLFLCTAHQSVIALDATTGKEIWRYDPLIQPDLALQHLTCRGLSYQPPSAADTGAAGAVDAAADVPAAEENTGADTDAGASAVAPAPSASPRPPVTSREGQPVAAQQAPVRESCPARLFMPTADGRIIALDPDSGAVCTDFGNGAGQINLWANMPNVKPGGYYSTSPVIVTRDLIIVGGTVLDNVSVQEPSGVIRAFDVHTGGLVWNWDPARPDNTEPVAPDATYSASSPNSWSISSVDEELGMVYVPMGNQPPDQWGADRTEEVERYSSSIVALDLATGRVRWHFQTVHHDLWDYDVPAQPSLLDLTVGGQTRPALVQPTKQGELFVLDRRTGEPILPVHEAPAPQGAAEGDHTAPTQPVSALSYDPEPLTEADMWGATPFDQLACRIAFHKLRYEGRYTPPSTQGTLVYPGNFGVFNWGGIAVDPRREVAFATPTYLAFVSELVPRADDTTLYVQGEERPEHSLPALNENFGAPYAVKLSPFLSLIGLPCQEPPWGYVAGADLRTGEIVWQHKNGTVRDSSPLPLPFKMGVPNLGGPIMTAGGVAFLSGTLDYYVRAYDVTNGAQLWQSRLPAGGQATPMTYTGADGRQYLLVMAGGHGSLGTAPGDAVIAYALPQ